MSLFHDILKYCDFCSGLYGFFGEGIYLDESRAVIANRLDLRGELFLEFLEENIFGDEGSPYLKLMTAAGLEFGDVKSMVLDKGVEGTLKGLAEKGVYLTIDEFKGRCVCERNGQVFKFREVDFDNRTTPQGFTATSGGTRGKGTPVIINFDYLKEKSIHDNLLFDAFNLSPYPVIVWFPGALGAMIVLEYAKIGKVPVKWFTQVDWTFQMKNRRFSSLKDWLMIGSMVAIGRMRGVRIPQPEFADFNNTLKVAESLSGIIKEHGGCFVTTYPSSALRICKIAREKELDVGGTKFLIGGEPITDSKRREIESAGAKVIAYYGSMEAGTIGMGCANPRKSDDCHLFKYYIALIQQGRDIRNFNVSVDAFLVTSFLPNAPKILLNVETGDMGVIEERRCGCAWEKLGFVEHVHTIRSFEKMTGEGMTILNTDLLRIVEEVLPEKFGGSITDYQIVEREEKGGLTKLDILISPDIGEVDEKEALETILTELKIRGRDSGSSGLSSEVWRKAETIKIKREYPRRTRIGKIFSFQVDLPGK